MDVDSRYTIRFSKVNWMWTDYHSMHRSICESYFTISENVTRWHTSRQVTTSESGSVWFTTLVRWFALVWKATSCERKFRWFLRRAFWERKVDFILEHIIVIVCIYRCRLHCPWCLWNHCFCKVVINGKLLNHDAYSKFEKSELKNSNNICTISILTS